MNAYDTALALYVMAKGGEDGTVDSYAPLDGSEYDGLPTYGYWVGGIKPSLVYRDVESIDRGELAWFIGSDNVQYYGVWVDSEDDRIYFDAVDHVEFLSDALFIAAERKEIAVWGIKEGREIRVETAGTYQDPEAAA